MDWNMTFMDVEYWAEKRGEERGISIGEERGISIGEERGISIGEKRGMVEAFLKVGYAPEKIAEEADIPLDKVNEIIGELQTRA